MKKLGIIFVWIMIIAGGAMNVQAASSSSRLQEGLYQEEMQGDVPGAVEIYQQIIADEKVSNDVAAQAMYRLGMCYMKLQNEIQARAVLTELTERFLEQTAIVAKAKELLQELIRIDPASLMPSDAIAYIEVGNPGRQFETLLKMLQGTPLANPLALMGGQKDQDAQASNMLSAILNPSMMTEFKKIQGFAVGVYSLTNNPSMVALLMPGKSDAVRGLILAGLGSQGKPGQSIEGMETFTLFDKGAAAHDNEIIIVVQDPVPMERLAWCVRQYKGLSNEPSLASGNTGFSRISRQNRERHALTIWVDADGGYRSLLKQFSPDKIPQGIRLADGFADFEHIDDALVSLMFDPCAIGCEALVHFKEGHRCLAYNMIRTPNLNREAFTAVPAEAFALASFALSDSTNDQVDQVQETMQQLTGLDIGREIFANMEQITLFAMPPSEASKKGVLAERVSPIANCLCAAITSHHPARTRQLLTQLLILADLSNSSNRESQVDTQQLASEGRFRLARMEGQPIYCYLDQVGKHTLLSLNRKVLDRSIASIQHNHSVLSDGPLKPSLDQLNKTSSKVILVNGTGIVHALDAHVHRYTYQQEMPETARLPLSEVMQTLADQCGSAGLQIQTDEQANTFQAKLMVHDIPPLSTLFPLFMQMSQSNRRNLFAHAVDPEPANGSSVHPGRPLNLRWTPGLFARGHKLYWGVEKNRLTLIGETSDNRFEDLPLLQAEMTYYWRVDEVQHDGSTAPGIVWSFRTDVSNESPVGLWKFDETSGDTAHDSSGSNLHGQLKRFSRGSSPWTSGHEGGGIRFDGQEGYVCLPGLNLNSNTVTITAWVRRQGDQDPYDGLVICRGGRTDATGLGFGSTSNKLSYHWDNEAWSYEWHSGLFVPDGKWVFVALAVEPDQATLYMVDDGQMSSATNKHRHIAIPFDAKLAVGRDRARNNPDRNYRGDIDEVRIYNRTLDQGDIEKLASGRPLDVSDTTRACYPYPSDGSTLKSSEKVLLRWSAPAGAVSYKVYFSATQDQLELLGELDTQANGIQTPNVEQDMTYYWRVDAVMSDGSVATGPVWSFKTEKTSH